MIPQMIKSYTRAWDSPDPNFQDPREELRAGRYELAAVEDQLLLQDGRRDAEGLHLAVDGLVDLGRGHRLVEEGVAAATDGTDSHLR